MSYMSIGICTRTESFVIPAKCRIRMGMEMPNRLSAIRKSRHLSMEKLAEMVDTSRGQIYQLESGKRRLTKEWMERLAVALRCRPSELIEDVSDFFVPVIGYVGAGAKVFPIDDHAKGYGLEEVECPAGYNPEYVVALCVRGDSMLPMLRDNWIIFYSKKADGVASDCHNQICVVALPDGCVMVKELRQGSRKGHYHLISHNAEPIFDQPLEWAARVIDIKPR